MTDEHEEEKRRKAWPPMGFGKQSREGEPDRDDLATWMVWYCGMVYRNASWVPAGDARLALEISGDLVARPAAGPSDADKALMRLSQALGNPCLDISRKPMDDALVDYAIEKLQVRPTGCSGDFDPVPASTDEMTEAEIDSSLDRLREEMKGTDREVKPTPSGDQQLIDEIIVACGSLGLMRFELVGYIKELKVGYAKAEPVPASSALLGISKAVLDELDIQRGSERARSTVVHIDTHNEFRDAIAAEEKREPEPDVEELRATVDRLNRKRSATLEMNTELLQERDDLKKQLEAAKVHTNSLERQLEKAHEAATIDQQTAIMHRDEVMAVNEALCDIGVPVPEGYSMGDAIAELPSMLRKLLGIRQESGDAGKTKTT